MKRSHISGAFLLSLMLIMSCKLSISTFDAPGSADAGKVIDLSISGNARDIQDGAGEHGIIMQIPQGWQVVYSNYILGIPKSLVEKPEYASLYQPEEGCKIWVGTGWDKGQGDHNITVKLKVLTGSFEGNVGDMRNFMIKAAVGTFRNGTWQTDDPQDIFDFSNILQPPYTKTISLTKVDDRIAPNPISTIRVEEGYDGYVTLDWTGYDEWGQGDVASYRIYRSAFAFYDVTGMAPYALVPAGSNRHTISGLTVGETCYLAVTAADEVPNENVHVMSVSITPQAGGKIEGLVTSESDGLPVAGLTVWATGNLFAFSGAESTTGTDGRYFLSRLPAGRYLIEVLTAETDFVHEYYEGAYTSGLATQVVVELGQTVSGIDFTLSTGGGIKGKVVRDRDSQPIADLVVRIYDDSNDAIMGEDITGDDGTYSVRGIPSGSYRVKVLTSGTDFTGGEYPSAVQVVAGQAAIGIDFRLVAAEDTGGSISGVVRRDDGQAIGGLCVEARRYDTSSLMNRVLTGEDGSYLLNNLSTGSYRVQVDTAGSDYIREYYNNAQNSKEADPVEVVGGSNTDGIDFSLSEGGSISGTVTQASNGQPISDMMVIAYDVVTQEGVACSSGPDGRYSVRGLAPGRYRISVSTGSTGYVQISYPNDVEMSQVQDVGGIDFALVPGGEIRGKVLRLSDNQPIPNLVIHAYDPVTQNRVGSGWTRTDGSYSIQGLPRGSYLVEAATQETGYVKTYYNDTAYRILATAVEVTPEQTTSDIDFHLATADGGISGMVRDPLGQPVSGARVIVQDYQYHEVMGYATTDPSGAYAIGNLLAGSYTVEVSKQGANFIREFFNNRYFPEQADPVQVAGGQTTPEINFALEIGGSISGVVRRQSDGQPLSTVWLNAYESDSNRYVTNASTDSEGTFTLGGLLSGTYRIRVSSSSYIAQERNVQVVLPHNTSGIDFFLEEGSAISGVIKRQSDNQPISGVTVQANDAVSGSWMGGGFSSTNGTYMISGLPSGTYRVSTSSWNTQYVSETYPETVEVTVGQTRTGVDFTLKPGGSVAGTVFDESGNPTEGILVRVYDYETGSWLASGLTEANGTYIISGIRAGEVKIQASSKWYVNTHDPDAATPIIIVADTTIAHIDFIVKDTDRDGTEDEFDADDDNDGFSDTFDDFPLDPGEWIDLEGDGIGDNADTDDDNDGVEDALDNCPLHANAAQTDTDGNGTGNACDDLLTEGFESGDFSHLSWTAAGAASWIISSAKTCIGNFSMHSPPLIDDQSASMETSVFCENGVVRFRYAVSSEAKYDFLEFYVDNELAGVWAGEFACSEAIFRVGSGLHTFRWVYKKDDSVSRGEDAAWVDDIRFPATSGPLPDSDGDGVPDSEDRFPHDPEEWEDTDSDGTGNNADTDDDNDGMSDSWESQYGLNPLVDDADDDMDSDGFTNSQEYVSGTYPNDPNSYPLKGDINGSGTVDLADAVMTLQVMAGLNPLGVHLEADVIGGGAIGMEEALYIIQTISTLREN